MIYKTLIMIACSVSCMPSVVLMNYLVVIQLWPCGIFMANGWYIIDNMTWFLTYWLITSGVKNWGVTVGIRAVVHGPCHRVCRLWVHREQTRKVIESGYFSVILKWGRLLFLVFRFYSDLFVHCVWYCFASGIVTSSLALPSLRLLLVQTGRGVV